MERTERNEKDDSQKAKLIFLALAALVVVLLIVSFGYANKARNELNAKNQELEAVKQDNAKLELMLKDANAGDRYAEKTGPAAAGKSKSKTGSEEKRLLLPRPRQRTKSKTR